MHLQLKDSTPRVLQWNAESNGIEIAQCVFEEIAVEQVPSRAEFLLQLVQRKHAFAVVVASHPFDMELSLLRQFVHQLENAPPVVLVLIDCPYAIVGLENEFFAVVQVDDSLSELSQVLQAALRQGLAMQRGGHSAASAADTRVRERGTPQNSVYQELTRARQMPIVSISGEIGTGKSLLARLLHQMRGGFEQDCFTFYCGQNENSVAASIAHMLQHTETPNTFVLRDPSKSELMKIAEMFAAEGARQYGTANQLIVLSETSHQLESDFALSIVPLRDRTEFIPEITAGILTSFANRFPDRSIEIDPAGIALLQKYDWPGNICEFNLALAASLLRQAMQPRSEICVSRTALRTVLSANRKTGRLSRMDLRNQLNELCNVYASRGWGTGQELRELLNQVSLGHARLAWQFQPQRQTQFDQKRKAA